MVIKNCIICGKEFDARGLAKCCSPECSKKRKREYDAQWRKNNRDYYRKWNKEYYENNRDYFHKWNKEYYENNRDEIIKNTCIRHQNIISELCEQYDGDLEKILEKIPNPLQVREAKMRVWFGESYYDGIIAKIGSTPVCEVTGESDDLVIHHLFSFNTHPELGADPNNMVRVCADIHKKFHSIYGKGNNTPEQWVEFVENY